MVTNVRKVNWISRQGMTALLVLADNPDVAKDLVTTPKLLQTTDLELSYGDLSSGLSELTDLGLITRKGKTVEYTNGMATRTFKATRSRVKPAALKELIGRVQAVYASKRSVEVIAAISTLVGISVLPETKANDGWFGLATYQRHMRVPNQFSRYLRTPADAVGFCEVDSDRKLYRWNRQHRDFVNLLLYLDAEIQSYNTSFKMNSRKG